MTTILVSKEVQRGLPNVLMVSLGVGETVQIDLDGGGTLEVMLDNLDLDVRRAGVFVSVTKPWGFDVERLGVVAAVGDATRKPAPQHHPQAVPAKPSPGEASRFT